MKLNILFLAAVVLLWGCSSSHKNEGQESSAAEKSNVGLQKTNWPVQMRKLAHDLEGLYPYVASKEEFLDDANSKQISGLIASFEKSVELVPRHAGEEMLGKDPIVKYAVSRLLNNTKQAHSAFSDGHREFARNLLKDNLALCFSCHTTTQLGPENNFSNKVLNSGFRITPTEKASYYVATRQFDRASSSLKEVLKAPVTDNSDLHEKVAALQQYLSLQVRVEKKPEEAIRVVENFLKNQLPYFIAVDTKAWLRSLKEWQSELNAPQKTLNSSHFLAQAKKVISQAKRVREDEGYQSGYVDYLRATSYLHEGLMSTPNINQKAEIYLMLGNCYEALAKSGTWDLPEAYFEACVRALPKTKLAEKCYADYERVTVMGFSGSAGVFLPKSEREHLQELKSISGLE